jgi:hypothetical protein
VASHQLVVAWALLRQLPDATMIWTSPSGQSHRTYPGSRLLFPSLCRPTAPVARVDVPAPAVNRGLMMPRRKSTREQDRAKRIDAERAGNQELREDGPENDCDDSYFPSRPPPAGDEDPPPF